MILRPSLPSHTRDSSATAVRQGLRANAGQLAVLTGLNTLVGAMVGLERSVLPLVGERDFGLASKTAILSFVLAFGAAKALANLAAGELAGRTGRRRVLLAGWILALPVPLLLGLAPSWAVVVFANVLLGASQGLTWSMTALMKVDLAGPARRGIALGLNETAGYAGVALAAFASGALAGAVAPRTVVWVGAILVAVAGTAVTLALVADTSGHVSIEHAAAGDTPDVPGVVRAWTFAGFCTNLNDALAWGLAPLYLAGHGASEAEIGLVAGVYPAVWAGGQLASGWLSDRIGRKPLVVSGMLLQAAALGGLVAAGGQIPASVAAAAVLGAGTALVYPTLMAAVADAVSPLARAAAVGRYRFWRDAGLVAGALAAGIGTDLVGSEATIGAVAAIVAASGLVAAATPIRTHGHAIA